LPGGPYCRDTDRIQESALKRIDTELEGANWLI
jgi:hypothetical protein